MTWIDVQEWNRKSFLGDRSALDIVFMSDSKLWWIGSISCRNVNMDRFIKSYKSGDLSGLMGHQDTEDILYYVISGDSAHGHGQNIALIRTDTGMETEEFIESVVEIGDIEFVQCGAAYQTEKLNKFIGNKYLFIWRSIGTGFLKAMFGYGK